MAFNPKGEVLVSAGNDKVIMFWSTKAFDLGRAKADAAVEEEPAAKKAATPLLKGKGKEEDKVEEAKAVEQQAESVDHRYKMKGPLCAAVCTLSGHPEEGIGDSA